MIELKPPFRRATPGDAQAMADFVHFASEGLALYLWTKMAGPGGDPWAFGRERASRETGGFSYRNADRGRARRPAGRRPHRLRAARPCRADPRNHAGHVRAAAGAGEPGARHLVRERARRLSRAPRPGLRRRASRRRRPARRRRGELAASASSLPIPTPARASSTSAAATAKPASARWSRKTGSIPAPTGCCWLNRASKPACRRSAQVKPERPR